MKILIRLTLIWILFLTGCTSYNSMSSSDSGLSFPSWLDHPSASNTSLPNNAGQHVVLLLPLQGNLAPAGLAVKAGFIAANQNNNVQIDTVDTSQYPSINAAYSAAQQKNPSIIVGPLSKADVAQLQQQNLSVPTLALNYADETSALPSNLYEFGLSPTQMKREKQLIVLRKIIIMLH